MNTKTLIDAVLNYTDNIGATDADNATRRARMLQYAQEVFDYVWLYADWHWAYRTTTGGSVGSDGIMAAPTGFSRFGGKGGLYRSTDGRQCDEEFDMANFLHRYNNSHRDNLEKFCRWGQNSTTGAQQFRFYATSGTITSLYLTQPPTLVDVDNETTSNLFFIPPSYHSTVLLPGVISKTRVSKGDMRDFEKDFIRGLGLMHAKEVANQTGAQVLPYTRRMW